MLCSVGGWERREYEEEVLVGRGDRGSVRGGRRGIFFGPGKKRPEGKDRENPIFPRLGKKKA